MRKLHFPTHLKLDMAIWLAFACFCLLADKIWVEVILLLSQIPQNVIHNSSCILPFAMETGNILDGEDFISLYPWMRPRWICNINNNENLSFYATEIWVLLLQHSPAQPDRLKKKTKPSEWNLNEEKSRKENLKIIGGMTIPTEFIVLHCPFCITLYRFKPENTEPDSNMNTPKLNVCLNRASCRQIPLRSVSNTSRRY